MKAKLKGFSFCVHHIGLKLFAFRSALVVIIVLPCTVTPSTVLRERLRDLLPDLPDITDLHFQCCHTDVQHFDACGKEMER